MATESSEEEVRKVAEAKDGSAVDGIELELPLVRMTAVPVLVFELIRELASSEQLRLELLKSSEG